MSTRLLLSRCDDDLADLYWDNADQSMALGGVSYEFALRIAACVNACADIPTESLESMNWQLAPKAGAKPIEVANLILKLGAYREALAQIAARDRAQEHEDNYMLACRVNAVIGIAQEALK